MSFDPATEVQDFLAFGEFGGVNPSITDSSTYTFINPEKMEELFEHEIEGCFLYSRHVNPSAKYLADALARMEAGASAQVMGSGMAAISCTLLQLCGAGDHIVSSRTIYGGSYALMKNLLPRFGINTSFVDATNLDKVKAAITDRTKAIYCETLSNPLLEVNDIAALSALAREHGIKLVVDNTFTPMIFSPIRLGADIVIHSLTKYINGTSDCLGGVVISDPEFIASLMDINCGPSMLLGPVLDSFRAASILKNLHSLHIRMKKHGENGLFLAKHLLQKGLDVHYPGLPDHPGHKLMSSSRNDGYGYGGILTLDAGSIERAGKLMALMQQRKVGYVAVSLGYFKTLFSVPGHSTSSEIPAEEQKSMGLTDGLIRFSIGLDNECHRTMVTIDDCLKDAGLL
jgi:methionine-gamma-lyase